VLVSAGCGVRPQKQESRANAAFTSSVSLFALPTETAIFLKFPIHRHRHISVARYIPELHHLMSFLSQFSPPAGLFWVLLDRLTLMAVYGEPDVPQPMSAGSANTEFLALDLNLVTAHEVCGDRSQQFSV
jgi:hypothetical protein